MISLGWFGWFDGLVSLVSFVSLLEKAEPFNTAAERGLRFDSGRERRRQKFKYAITV